MVRANFTAHLLHAEEVTTSSFFFSWQSGLKPRCNIDSQGLGMQENASLPFYDFILSFSSQMGITFAMVENSVKFHIKQTFSSPSCYIWKVLRESKDMFEWYV